jgi:hypothetical protein
MRDLVKCLDCKNLVRIYIDSAFAWFEEKRKCKVRNTIFDQYYEVEKERAVSIAQTIKLIAQLRESINSVRRCQRERL